MQAYPLPERWFRRQSQRFPTGVAVSSGSEVTRHLPRSVTHELDVALRFEQGVLRQFPRQ